MPSRRYISLVLALVVVPGGCLGAPVASDSPENGSGATTTASPPVPDGPAKRLALDAEETYLESVFRNASCLETWGTSPTVTTEDATVVERSTDGVRVEVRHPYSYSTTNVAADGASEATYRVTETDTERLTGDTPSPC